MKRVDVSDLIGLPWSVANCAAIAFYAANRCGVSCPWLREWLNATAGPSDADLNSTLEQASKTWKCVGSTGAAATKLGDVILMACSGGLRFHVAVVVDEDTPFAIVSDAKNGAHLIRPVRLARVLSVWRWQPSGVTST